MRALDQNEQDFRKRKILQVVICEYIRTGKPVGSQALVSSSRMNLSSATIRNILMDLEKEGLITHPHTSAGRVPTDKGYRFYVDSLSEMQRLAAQEKARIEQEYEMRMREVEDVMVQTTKMLSAMSNCAGFVMTPKLDKNIFSSIELVQVAPGRVLVVMLTQNGMSKHFIIAVPRQISRENLRYLARTINQRCQGQTLQQVKNILAQEIQNIQNEMREMFDIMREIEEEISKLSMSQVYWNGTSNILSLPDLNEQTNLQNLFRMMENKQALAEILEEQAEQMDKEVTKKTHAKQMPRVRVQIGSENTIKELQNLSVISSTYKVNDHTVGVLGILGPKRMQYDKMISLVDYVSQIVNQMLRNFEEPKD